MAKVASDFEKIINADRTRKKNEALAARIFNRRSSTPTAGPLARSSGINKRAASMANLRAGSINSEWTHDLHGSSAPGHPAIPRGPRALVGNGGGGAAAASLSSRVSRPGDPPARQQRRAAQIARALIREEQTGAARRPAALPPPVQKSTGLAIRGLAAAANEPLVVMAQNFAPGTTAADIESAMTPVGGIISSCRILKTTPLVIAEIVFETRDGAERVIETFNNQTADGRLLHVYPKAGQPVAPPRALAASRNNAAKPNNGYIVDGSLGFDDPMDTDYAAAPSSKLYSDDLVGTRPPTGPAASRRGRGGYGGRGRR